MTIIEAAVFSGIPAGAIIGGTIGKSHGVLGLVAGSLAGIVGGAVAGFVYSVLIVGVFAIVDACWRARCNGQNPEPSEAAWKLMSTFGARGAFYGTAAAIFCWFGAGWLRALLVAFIAAVVFAFYGVAECVRRSPNEKS